jgi:DNA-binding XRE family transcriptional regulator
MSVDSTPPAALNPDDELATLDRTGLACRMRSLRRERGWRQIHVADACEVSRFTVSQWERARFPPGTTMLLRLADVFGCSLDYLLRGR